MRSEMERLEKVRDFCIEKLRDIEIAMEENRRRHRNLPQVMCTSHHTQSESDREHRLTTGHKEVVRQCGILQVGRRYRPVLVN